MVKYLLVRPIATLVIALTLVALGSITSYVIPVSLLPDIPVPEITVQASYPNANAREIQQVLALPLSNQLRQLSHLDDLEAESQDGLAVIRLRFDYNTDINLVYIEANEKIDMLMETLPRDLPRPRLIKASAGDLPVFQLNVSFKSDENDIPKLSELCENVLKRRLEQLPEIAFVDISGLSKNEVVIKPNLESLQYMGFNFEDLTKLIEEQIGEIGNISLKDGSYEYSITFSATLDSVEEIQNLLLKIGGENPRLVRLGDIANVSLTEQKNTGLFTFNGKRAIAMAVIKRSDAQLLKLRLTVDQVLSEFEREYPSLKFDISQDQTELLDISIKNLTGSLLTGAVLSFIMILFFMGEKKILLIIGLIIPITLAITLFCFYLIGISINIVSLAGLVLGIGEIVDSAIIIIENIEQKRLDRGSIESNSVMAACIDGTEDVIWPLFTSVLTNSVVYLPLLFISGIAAALFYDQAISVSISLAVSLLTSYALVPLLYYRLFRNEKKIHFTSTVFARRAEILYNRFFALTMRRPTLMVVFWFLLLSVSILALAKIEKEGMPDVSRSELEMHINWNEPISLLENQHRVKKLTQRTQRRALELGLFIGQQQFLLTTRAPQSTNDGLIIAKFASSQDYKLFEKELSNQIRNEYPMASFEIRPALNVFEQLFQTSEPPIKLLLSSAKGQATPELDSIQTIVERLRNNGIKLESPPKVERVRLSMRPDRLLLYGVEQNQIIRVLRIALNDENIGTMFSAQGQVPIFLSSVVPQISLHQLLTNTFVNNIRGEQIPIAELVTYEKIKDYRSLYLGIDGAYVSLIPEMENSEVNDNRKAIESMIEASSMFNHRFKGTYFQNQSYLVELRFVIIIAIGILFFILAAQFESVLQPFIVLLTIAFGLSGALLCLYIAGSSINIMSAIGMIVLIGLLDNDSILKIDTMNRSREKLELKEVIRLGGLKRLQSQLMTFLTTVLGLLPILWSNGLGAELQKPLAISVIGGMSFGVIISWTFIPLTYYWIYKRKEKPRKF